MIRFVIISVLTLAVAKTMAGDFEDGMAAIERKDYATALAKFRSAAQQGNAAAQYNLGVMYGNGDGVAQDYKEAVRWYLLAAKQGFASAQKKVGSMYGVGHGVAKDYVRAYMWLYIADIPEDENKINIRYIIASKMTAQQIEQAQRMARECMSSNYAKCD